MNTYSFFCISNCCRKGGFFVLLHEELFLFVKINMLKK